MTDEMHTTDVSGHSAWIRLLYLILFALILYITQGVVFILAVVQFIFHLFTGHANTRLAEVGASVGVFMNDVVVFLTYRKNRLPFPFSEWPKVGAKPE